MADIRNLLGKCSTLNDGEIQDLIKTVMDEEKQKLGVKGNIDFDIKNLFGEADGLNEATATDGGSSLKHQITIDYGSNSSSLQQVKQAKENKGKSPEEAIFGLISLVCHEVRHAYQRENGIDDTGERTEDGDVIYDIDLMENDAEIYEYNRALEYIDNYSDLKNTHPKIYEKFKGRCKSGTLATPKPKREIEQTIEL